MNSIIFFFLIIISQEMTSFAQVTAGSTPPGNSIFNPNINLSRTVSFTDTTGYLDLDCDGTDDIGLQLSMGMPAIDLPNGVILHELNSAFTICIDTGAIEVGSLFNFGDTLCTGYHLWYADSVYGFGCYGTFICYAPGAVTNKYIAYKKTSTSEEGWIRISFDLMFYPIILSVDTMLVLCVPSGISHSDTETYFHVGPNPTSSGKLNILSEEKLKAIEIYNSMGVLLKSFNGNEAEIVLPETNGIYLIRVQGISGTNSMRKVLRL
jgi:hypothetical protein